MTLTSDDEQLLRAIADEPDSWRMAQRIYYYYHDRDRADRTERSTLYLHLGMLTGVLHKVLNKQGNNHAPLHLPRIEP